jgi:hypothetical protein
MPIPTLQKTRTAQYPLVAEFRFSVTDTVTNTAGAVVALNTALAADVIRLPPNALVISGELLVETLSNAGTTHTISIGDSALATRYVNAAVIMAPTVAGARTAFTLTGLNRNTNGDDIRITTATTGTAATAGTFSIRVMYVMLDRASENTAP